MACTTYIAKTTPIPDVTAPVTGITTSKVGEDVSAGTDNIRVYVTCGAGSGTQPDLNFTVNGVVKPGFPRAINGTTTIQIFVPWDTTINICAT